VFIEAKDDGGVGDNWTTGAISRAKLQSNHHHQQTNIQFFFTACWFVGGDDLTGAWDINGNE